MGGISRRGFACGSLAAATTLAVTPIGSARASINQPREPLWFVNPELRPAARQLQDMLKHFPPFSTATLAASRQVHFSQPPSGGIAYAKHVIPSKFGPEVGLYVINAKPGEHRGGILHMHGGGFITGSAFDSVRDLQGIAGELDCTIVTVEYRLAPETRWSGSLEDNYAGLRWLHDHSDELGVDRARIAVMGESAGGGHAALLAIAARNRGEVPIAFQCLTYPMLDDRTGSTRAVKAPIGTIGWDGAANRFGWTSFLGRAPGQTSSEGVPARVANLEGLPPAWIGVGSIDLFVDEDVEYARRLIAADVQTGLLVVPGAFHGFDGIAADTSIARSFKVAKLTALRRGLTS